MPVWAGVGIAALFFGGYGLKYAGDGINDASNGAVKIAGAALIGWYVLTQLQGGK